MAREDWGFKYTYEQVLDGAVQKKRRHEERLHWWEGKKAEVIETVKAEGIEIDESLADKLASNYNRGATIQIRNDLAADLQECVGKIREHTVKVREYDSWVQILSDQPRLNLLDLDQSDWLHFFGK